MLTFDLFKIDWNAISAIITFLLAIIGLVINRQISKQTKNIERFGLFVEYRKEIKEYSAVFFELVSEALAQCELNNYNKEQNYNLSVIATKLSALADTGRFLFPNYNTGEHNYGHAKGPAFEGSRRPQLDAVLAAHYAVTAMCYPSGKEQDKLLLHSLSVLQKTNQPLEKPVREDNPKYLLMQSRKCFLNCTIPDTSPRFWLNVINKTKNSIT